MKTLKAVIEVAISNIANFGTSFILGFILPSILSVSEYGYYRQYALYISFAYIVNFGFNDGIYIKYGGTDKDTVDKSVIRGEHFFIILFQLIILLVMLFFSWLTGNLVVGLFSFSAFFITTTTYHQNLLQAMGQFSAFTVGNISKSIFYVFLLLLGILIFKFQGYQSYVLLNIISFIFLYLVYEIIFISNIGLKNITLSKNDILQLFYNGIFVLIGNISLTFVANVGNWIVNFGFEIESFAQYSFQNSVLNIILLVVNAVGMVFYNLISKSFDTQLLIRTKQISLLVGIFSGLTYFIFDRIIFIFLPDYVESLALLSMTFLSIPFIMVSKILIANLYKAKRTPKKYFLSSILFAGASFIVVFLSFHLWNDLRSIAFATTLCYLFWYLYNSLVEFKELRGNLNEVILIFSYFIVFYISSNLLPFLLGVIVYSFYLILITILLREDILSLLRLLKIR